MPHVLTEAMVKDGGVAKRAFMVMMDLRQSDDALVTNAPIKTSAFFIMSAA